MKQLFYYCLIIPMMVLTLVSCEKPVDNTVTVVVNVSMPADFPQTAKYNGNVILSSTTTDKEYTIQAVDGVATIPGVYQDIYDVTVSQTMTYEEFKTVAPELATSSSIILSGNAKAFKVIKDPEATVNPSVSVSLSWCVESSLLISKIFYNGTKKNSGSNNNMPKYVEIYNNTAETIYLDGLCFGLAHGNTTSANPCQLYLDHKDATYAQKIGALPGVHGTDKKIALEGGKSLVLALMAINYYDPAEGTTKQTMAPDLSTADYEIFSTASWFTNNESVPDMTPLHDCLPSAGFGSLNPAVIIFFASQTDVESWEIGVDESSYTVASQKLWQAKRVPNSIILDAVETYKKDASQQKRIPDALDAVGIESANNEGIIFDRAILYITEDGRKVLKDTNNSSKDFVAIASRDRENYDGKHLVPRDYDKPEIQPK